MIKQCTADSALLSVRQAQLWHLLPVHVHSWQAFIIPSQTSSVWWVSLSGDLEKGGNSVDSVKFGAILSAESIATSRAAKPVSWLNRPESGAKLRCVISSL